MQCDVVVVVSNVSFEAFNLGVKKRFQKEFRLAPSAGRGGQLLKVTCGISRNIRAISMSSQTNNEHGRSFPKILERVLEQVASAHRKQRSQTDVARRITGFQPMSNYAREDLQRGCQVQAFVNDARSTLDAIGGICSLTFSSTTRFKDVHNKNLDDEVEAKRKGYDDEHHMLNIFHLHNDSLEPVCKLKKVYMIKVFYEGYSTFEANPFVPIYVLGSMVHVLMLDTLSKRWSVNLSGGFLTTRKWKIWLMARLFGEQLQRTKAFKGSRKALLHQIEHWISGFSYN
ncbi:hypothetical protein Tco_1155675 [Tanacetum coccineum]